MTRQYSPRDFLRRSPKALLARYFHEQDLLTELDIASLKGKDVEPIFQAWQALPEEQRARVDADLYQVHSLSDGVGVSTIIGEGRFHGEDLEPLFGGMGGSHEKALWAFLERREYLDVASRLRETDERPRRYWWRRSDGIAEVEPRDGRAACRELAGVVASYFQAKEGRGRACQVEPYRRGDRFYFFCYSEDHGETRLEFEGTQLKSRTARPVFDVVFVYTPGERVVDAYFEGPKQVAEELTQLFASVALGTEIAPASKDQRAYNLNCLKDRHFRFVYEPAGGIRDVRVKELRLSVLGVEEKLTLEANPSRDRYAVYELMDKVASAGVAASDGGPRIPLAMVNVTRAGLQAVLAADGRRGKPTKTFYVTWPNGCTLRHEGLTGFCARCSSRPASNRGRQLRRSLVDLRRARLDPSLARGDGRSELLDCNRR